MKHLTRFLQLRQTGLGLIRVRRVGMVFYDLPIKFRRMRSVVLLLFELRGIVQILRFVAAAHEHHEPGTRQEMLASKFS